MASRKFAVWVKPSSKKVGTERLADGSYTIRVREPAKEGKATKAALKALAEELGVPPSHLRLLHGKTSRKKVFELLD